MSAGKFLTGTIIVTPAVGVVGYVTYDQLYNSETVVELKPAGASLGGVTRVDTELNRREAALAGIDEEGMVDVTLVTPVRN